METPLPEWAERIPAELRARPQWVVWRQETRGDKPTKVPYCVRTRTLARTNDPSTWSPFDLALAEFQARRDHWSGVGYVFSADDPYTGGDLDKCIDRETGEIAPWAQEILERMWSYAEISPSGTGIKFIVRGALPRGADGKTKHKQTGMGDGAGAVELYDCLRFFTLTGRALPDMPATIGERQRELEELYAALFPAAKVLPSRVPAGAGSGAGNLDDAAVIQKASGAKNGMDFIRLFFQGDTSCYDGDDSRADLALCRLLAFFTGPDPHRIDRLFRQSRLYREKWDRDDYRERTLTKSLEGVTEFYSGAPGEASWRASAAAVAGGTEEPPEEPEDLDALLAAAVTANGDRPAILERLARAVVFQPLLADVWAEKVKAANLATKAAFLGQVTVLERAQKRAARAAIRARRGNQSGEPDGDRSHLPRINAGLHDLEQVTAAAWDALLQANDPPFLFRHGTVPVRIELDDSSYPIIRTLNEGRLRHVLARVINWYCEVMIDDEKVQVPALPPKHVVEDILATPNMSLPVVTRIVEAPIFGPDGTLQTEPGYHPGSQTYYAPAAGFEIPPVPDEPTAAEIRAAVELLLDELLGDFPFTRDAERAHALAAILQPYLRCLIRGATPVFLIEKPSPGTGATLLCDMLTYPALGHPVPAMTEGKEEDEWRKRLTAKLLTGPSVILIDNLRRRFDSGVVSSIITADVWEDRRLGVSDIVRIPVRCLWLATGNNPSLSGELARRTVRIRLDAKRDRPWLREEFRHPNLRLWAQENRGRLVAAALTLCRAWFAAGRPLSEGPILGMFEGWSTVLGGVLQVAGVEGFLTNLDEFYKATDAEAAAVRGLIIAWWETFQDREVGVSELWGLACECDPPLDLGEGSERSQKTRLGRTVLPFLRDRQYALELENGNVNVRVVAGGKVKRIQQWRLAQVVPSTAAGAVDECSLPGAGNDSLQAGLFGVREHVGVRAEPPLHAGGDMHGTSREDSGTSHVRAHGNGEADVHQRALRTPATDWNDPARLDQLHTRAAEHGYPPVLVAGKTLRPGEDAWRRLYEVALPDHPEWLEDADRALRSRVPTEERTDER